MSINFAQIDHEFSQVQHALAQLQQQRASRPLTVTDPEHHVESAISALSATLALLIEEMRREDPVAPEAL